jgi:DNA-binding GntR family transcriptional regulator
MTAVRANGLVGQVYDAVRAGIVAGEHASGSGLNIADTAKRLGVSATPVREAFARLAAEGALVFRENMGYSVPAAPTGKEYADWAVARVIVECGALDALQGPVDARLVDEAATANDEIAHTSFGTSADGIRRYSELNWRFHACLIALARNPTLSDLHRRLYAAPQFARVFLGRGIPNQQQVADEHEAILRALRDGEHARAAAAMRAHIVDSLERDARMADIPLSLRRLAHRTPAGTTGPHPKEDA